MEFHLTITYEKELCFLNNSFLNFYNTYTKTHVSTIKLFYIINYYILLENSFYNFYYCSTVLLHIPSHQICTLIKLHLWNAKSLDKSLLFPRRKNLFFHQFLFFYNSLSDL